MATVTSLNHPNLKKVSEGTLSNRVHEAATRLPELTRNHGCHSMRTRNRIVGTVTSEFRNPLFHLSKQHEPLTRIIGVLVGKRLANVYASLLSSQVRLLPVTLAPLAVLRGNPSAIVDGREPSSVEKSG